MNFLPCFFLSFIHILCLIHKIFNETFNQFPKDTSYCNLIQYIMMQTFLMSSKLLDKMIEHTVDPYVLASPLMVFTTPQMDAYIMDRSS